MRFEDHIEIIKMSRSGDLVFQKVTVCVSKKHFLEKFTDNHIVKTQNRYFDKTFSLRKTVTAPRFSLVNISGGQILCQSRTLDEFEYSERYVSHTTV